MSGYLLPVDSCDNSQRVLAAVYRLALVAVELSLNISILELSVAPFADARPCFTICSCASAWLQSSVSARMGLDLWKSNSTTTARYRHPVLAPLITNRG